MIIPKLTNKQKALIALAVGALLFLALKFYNVPDSTVTAKHIAAVVEAHKQEVKDLEQTIVKIREETDKNVPQVESLDIDPLVDYFNDWLRSRAKTRREHGNDY